LCFAASRIGTEATGRLWAASDADVETRVTRRAVALPERAEALTTGRKHLAFASVGRFALPKSARSRIELTLPRNAWAVLLDESGQALDLCAPTADLQRCILTSLAGSVVIANTDAQKNIAPETFEIFMLSSMRAARLGVHEPRQASSPVCGETAASVTRAGGGATDGLVVGG